MNPGEVSYRVGQVGTLMVLYSARDTSNSVLNRLLSPTVTSGRGSSSEVAAAGQLRLSLQEQLLTAGAMAAIGKQDGGNGIIGAGQQSMPSSTTISSGGGGGGGLYRRNSATGAVFDAAPGGAVEASTSGVNPAASPTFELSSPNDLKFTVGSFAMTRFGTTKLKVSMISLWQLGKTETRRIGSSNSSRRGTLKAKNTCRFMEYVLSES